MFKPSGNLKVKELTKSIRDRSYNLSCLQAIKLPEMNAKGKPKRLCAWCAATELTHGNQKYCTEGCSRSAMAWAYPQKEDSLRFLLIRQEWKCAHCFFDYRPAMESIMERERIKRPYEVAIEKETPMESLPWYYFKRLKGKVPSERKPEIDHVLAISKGGDSLGLENHQALCYTCHKSKTKVDLSGKRPKNKA